MAGHGRCEDHASLRQPFTQLPKGVTAGRPGSRGGGVGRGASRTRRTSPRHYRGTLSTRSNRMPRGSGCLRAPCPCRGRAGWSRGRTLECRHRPSPPSSRPAPANFNPNHRAAPRRKQTKARPAKQSVLHEDTPPLPNHRLGGGRGPQVRARAAQRAARHSDRLRPFSGSPLRDALARRHDDGVCG